MNNVAFKPLAVVYITTLVAAHVHMKYYETGEVRENSFETPELND